MSVVPAIVALEMYYRDYLFVCKSLLLDPTKVYEQSFIDKKIDDALANSEVKKEQKKFEWFKKYYRKMEGGFFGNKLISRAKKEIGKGKLVLDYEISDND